MSPRIFPAIIVSAHPGVVERRSPPGWPGVGKVSITLLTGQHFKTTSPLLNVLSRMLNGRQQPVLAGSVNEALLLWALSQDKKRALAAPSAPKGKTDLGRWDLVDLVKVAGELRMIGNQTTKQADLARDYRNLIHSAVAVRRKMVADSRRAQLTPRPQKPLV
jgi:hypothetical protein